MGLPKCLGTDRGNPAQGCHCFAVKSSLKYPEVGLWLPNEFYDFFFAGGGGVGSCPEAGFFQKTRSTY